MRQDLVSEVFSWRSGTDQYRILRAQENLLGMEKKGEGLGLPGHRLPRRPTSAVWQAVESGCQRR